LAFTRSSATGTWFFTKRPFLDDPHDDATVRILAAATAIVLLSFAAIDGQVAAVPAARLVPAPPIQLPGEIDSSNPFVWDAISGLQQLFVVTSWGGVPVQSSGNSLEQLHRGEAVTFATHPGHGVWMESIVPDDAGTWYGFYHHERPADECGRPDRQLPRIGAARSTDRGRTWDDLGIVLDAPPGSAVCASTNRFVLGGVGDVSALLDAGSQDVYLFFSQYFGGTGRQGVAVARLAWADRDAPAGKATIFSDGAWLPIEERTAESPSTLSYPPGTPLARASRPFHDGDKSADVYWGASVHWNTYLEQYVMLLNRAKDENFGSEGIYLSYSRSLSNPSEWTAPHKLIDGGEWYPQVVGIENGAGTDRLAGRRARFFMTGKSNQMIEFSRPF
jgi:hypothetical protein